MDDQHLMHELRFIANEVIGFEQGLKRLDLLELEILQIKSGFREKIQKIRNHICSILGAISATGDIWNFGEDFDNFYSNRPQTNNLIGNGFGNQQKTIAEIIEEIKAMIIELKIKGSVREHRNGLLKFTSTMLERPIYGRSKEEIEEKLHNQLKQLKKKPQKDKKAKNAPLLSEFYRAEYLPYKRRQGRAESTLSEYESEMRFIVKMKFDKPLNFYKSKEIEDFLYSFPEPRKRQMIQGLLNNIFNRALTLGLIQSNPCTPIDRAQHTQEQGMAYSFAELIEFLQLLISNTHLSYNDKCYFIFCALVGTRRNEALALTVEDVDFENKVLHIKGTKTKGSDRNVPLTALVEKLLLSLKVKKDKYFNLTEANTNKYFREVWEKKKGHKLHDLRHTYGTIQICVNKINVKTVSLWLGHSNIETTLRTYTHPEQLDKGTFYRGDLSEIEKTATYKCEYDEILHLIEQFIG